MLQQLTEGSKGSKFKVMRVHDNYLKNYYLLNLFCKV
jgi:hypothetical protein